MMSQITKDNDNTAMVTLNGNTTNDVDGETGDAQIEINVTDNIEYIELTSDSRIEVNRSDSNHRQSEPENFPTEINMDELLDKEVKGNGKWQFMISLLLALTLSAPVLFPVFANSTPLNRCRVDKAIEEVIRSHNFSFNQVVPIIGPWNFGNTKNDKGITKANNGCYRYKINWTKKLFLDAILNRTGIANNITVEPCNMGYVFELTGNEYPGNMVMEFKTVCKKAWLTPFSTSMYMLGMAIGTLVGGALGDRFGRKWTMVYVTAFELICGIWVSFSPNYISYVIARYFMGNGNSIRLLLGNVMLGEITVPRYRSIFVSILLIGYNFIPRALMSLWAFLIPNWRWLNLASLAPSCLFVLYIFLLPESPRWLLAKGRCVEAIEVLSNAYRINHNKTNTESSAKLEFLKQYYSNHGTVDQETSEEQHESSSCSAKFYLKLKWFMRPFQRFQDAKNIVFATIFVSLFMVTLLSLFLYARSIKGSPYLIAFVNAANSIPGLIISTLIYRYTIYRKRSLFIITFIIVILLGSSSIYTFVVQPANDIVLILFTNIALVLMNTVTNMCYVYIPELYSIEFKSYAFGLTYGIARFSTLGSSYLINLDKTLGHGAPVIVFSGLLLIGLLSLILVNETDGKSPSERIGHISSHETNKQTN